MGRSQSGRPEALGFRRRDAFGCENGAKSCLPQDIIGATASDRPDFTPYVPVRSTAPFGTIDRF